MWTLTVCCKLLVRSTKHSVLWSTLWLTMKTATMMTIVIANQSHSVINAASLTLSVMCKLFISGYFVDLERCFCVIFNGDCWFVWFFLYWIGVLWQMIDSLCYLVSFIICKSAHLFNVILMWAAIICCWITVILIMHFADHVHRYKLCCVPCTNTVCC